MKAQRENNTSRGMFLKKLKQNQSTKINFKKTLQWFYVGKTEINSSYHYCQPMWRGQKPKEWVCSAYLLFLLLLLVFVLRRLASSLLVPYRHPLFWSVNETSTYGGGLGEMNQSVEAKPISDEEGKHRKRGTGSEEGELNETNIKKIESLPCRQNYQ